LFIPYDVIANYTVADAANLFRREFL